MESILEDLFRSHRTFYGDYFKDEFELDKFILGKLNYQASPVPRRMINTVPRLISLANEMDIIKPGRRDLSIFFIITCIEALHSLQLIRMQKQEMVIIFFEKFLSLEDQKKIIDNVKILSVNREYKWFDSITMEQFALLLCAIRNNVAHEGIYWSFTFKGESEDAFKVVNSLKSKIIKNQPYNEISYEVGLSYSEFLLICMRGFINYINHYFNNL
ncbi:MAG TPA: hypothetical protein VFC84_11580 [Desulfosporosinus sp.]|nr:hypothetical protein [Desulfosporosinus sp.]